MTEQREIFGTYLFGAESAQKGYALNAMCFSFNDKANRDAFQADPEGYSRKWNLTEEQIEAVLSKDVLKLIHAGGNIYYLAKMTGIYGYNMQDIGAQQTGVSLDEFKQNLLDAGK